MHVVIGRLQQHYNGVNCVKDAEGSDACRSAVQRTAAARKPQSASGCSVCQ